MSRVHWFACLRDDRRSIRFRAAFLLEDILDNLPDLTERCPAGSEVRRRITELVIDYFFERLELIVSLVEVRA